MNTLYLIIKLTVCYYHTLIMNEHKQENNKEHSEQEDDYESDYDSEDNYELKECDRCKDHYIFDGKFELRLLYKFEGEMKCKQFCNTDCMTKHEEWIRTFKTRCEISGCPNCNQSLLGPGCLECGNRPKNGVFTKRCMSDGLVSYYCSVPCEIKSRKNCTFICFNCDNIIKESGEKKKMFVCASCRKARYCSKECQIAHWSNHKKICKEIVEERKYPLFTENAKFTCGLCFKKSVKPFERCSGCKIIYYCSAKCQKEDWKKGHKKECKEFAKFQQTIAQEYN